MLLGLWGAQPAQLTAVKEDRSARVSPHRQEQAAPQKPRRPRWTWPCLGWHRLCRPQNIQPRLQGMPGLRVLLKRRKLNLVVILAGVSGIFPRVKHRKCSVWSTGRQGIAESNSDNLKSDFSSELPSEGVCHPLAVSLLSGRRNGRFEIFYAKVGFFALKLAALR